MAAYYNEFDEKAAAWLRELICGGHIAPGDVDTRSILDVRPDDLRGYTQCHFFAGIGGWSYALRLAGWPDDRPVWTGSCPCQPFSAAGKGGGFADERHLWPAFFHLIEQRRPAIVFGEQVASPDGLRWLDLVQDDMEGAGYAFGAADTCAAGACVDFADSEEGRATIEWIRGAVLSCPDPFLAAELSDFAAWAGANLGYGPAHIRQRLYWVADADQGQRGWLADRQGRERDRATAGRQQGNGIAQSGGAAERLGYASGAGLAFGSLPAVGPGTLRDERPPVAAHGPSHGSDWIICTDGKARPTQPGILPLAHAWEGPSRVALLRSAGNAINKACAAEFIGAARDTFAERNAVLSV